MPKPESLTQLQRNALVAALQSPTHSLTRTRAGFTASDAPHGADTTAFTYRLMRMLERAWLIEFDDPAFPSRATLNANGLAIAEQLRDADVAKAVVA